jgi:hypothetical protein
MKTYSITYSVERKTPSGEIGEPKIITKIAHGTSTIDAITKYFDNCPDYMIKRFELVSITEVKD